jgi:hypothetical protein
MFLCYDYGIVKIAALVVFLAVVLPTFGQKNGSQSTPHQSEPTTVQQPKQPSAPTVPLNQGASSNQGEGTKNHPEDYISRLFSPENLPNIGLFVAGIIGIVVALATLRNLAKQTHLLVVYTAAARRGVLMASKSAEAARDSIELVINKERARLRIEMERPWLEVGSDHVPEYPEVRYRVEIYGATPAFVDDHEATAYIADSADAAAPHPTNVPMGLRSVINADTPPI